MRVGNSSVAAPAPGLLRADPGGRTARFLLLFVAVAATSCQREPEGPDLATDTYIEVMVALRRAQTYETSPAAFEARRQQILRDAGVTDSLLVQWARVHGDDVAFMAEVWDSINARLVAGADTAR